MTLINGDCLSEMDKLIEQGVTVDAIITDPPYGTTACKWDSVIPFEAMWERLNKLIKPNGAIVLFGSEPFSSALRMSNIKNYKYDWIWEKTIANGGMNAKKRPLNKHENIIVFYDKQPIFNPIMEKGKPYFFRRKGNKQKEDSIYPNFERTESVSNGDRYPSRIIRFNSVGTKITMHPTQKPVALMEYLIKTYTNENETVLDFTMGSGSTGVACRNTNRNFIGIELDKGYFDIATKRINEVQKGLFDD